MQGSWWELGSCVTPVPRASSGCRIFVVVVAIVVLFELKAWLAQIGLSASCYHPYSKEVSWGLFPHMCPGIWFPGDSNS